MKTLLYVVLALISQTDSYISGRRLPYYRHRLIPRKFLQWPMIYQRSRLLTPNKYEAANYPVFRVKQRRELIPRRFQQQNINDLNNNYNFDSSNDESIYFDTVQGDGVQEIVNVVLDVVHKALDDLDDSEYEEEEEEIQNNTNVNPNNSGNISVSLPNNLTIQINNVQRKKKKSSLSTVTDVVSKVLTETLRNSSILDD